VSSGCSAAFTAAAGRVIASNDAISWRDADRLAALMFDDHRSKTTRGTSSRQADV
jgi:hypothetical protein